jgi:ribosomal protein S18 acetylase RimI-like enzyme
VPLPPGLSLRPPEPRDAQIVTDISNAETMSALGLADTTPEELLATWSQPQTDEGPRSAVAVDADDGVVAYLQLHVDLVEHEVFGYAALPLDAPADLGDAMLAEIEERAAWWHGRAGVEEGTLRIGALDAPCAWAAALERASYRLTRRFLLMRRSLEEPVEPPRWPAGVELRPFRRDHDAPGVHAALAEAFADHYGPPFDPYETWFHLLFVQPTLAFRDDLIIVAWSGDEIAGALIAAAAAQEAPGGGYVAELGVRRAYRGRGLGRALLLESFERLRAAGRVAVVLHVDANSETGADGLYRRVGMREQRMYASWLPPVAG